ncbi:transforming growth factor beta regulator 1 isoform X2 [Daktulosphaira vitifoliae]|uniref:transforming growth factor beta regulator 1 isoform X2 n=1 Tax=Daktulosphaira vitifoliae TaxID=58002 RepID=UPI0021A9FDAB|nr:transforming growth factor beta regulator 1 isoform X2 [Daktulosphaira vitifoliae]
MHKLQRMLRNGEKITFTEINENASVCDEISHIQEKLLIVREECKFLIKKMKQFEPQFDLEAANIESNAIKKTSVRKKTNLNGVPKPKRLNLKKKKNLEELEVPISIGSVTILNFGQIVYDTPFYHTDCAVYPAGYYATRIYAHYRSINSKCIYHCRIIKAGTSPRFEIIDQEKNFKVTGLSSDECHSHLISLINKLLGTDDLIPSNNNGDLFFGLTLPTVRFQLQKNNEIKFCKGYVSLLQQPDNHSDNFNENDPSVSYDGLQEYLKKFHTR